MPKQKSKEVKQWITIKGNHIPVYEGESVDDAAKKFMKHEKSSPAKAKAPMSRREKLEERQQKYNEMEDVLGEPFDPELVREIETDWNAFYKDPKKYKGTVVPELVNHYIDQHPITKGAYDKAYRKAHKEDETEQVTKAIKERAGQKNTTKEQALKDIKGMKLNKMDRDDMEYLYKDTGGAWVHADAMERAIEKPLSGKKTSTEKSLRRNFDNMLRDWEDVRDTVESEEARKWLDKEISQYKKRFEDNMKKWKGNK